MKKLFLLFIVVTISLASCNSNKYNNNTIDWDEITEQGANEIKYEVETNFKGNKLEYVFNNTTNTAIFILNGEKIKMMADDTKASGTHYKNNNYSYTNWHGITELKKGGKTIFYHNSNLVENVVQNKEGKIFKMKFDNSTNTASFIFDNKTIDLKADTTASGIRYSNKDYVFTEHQGDMEFLKDNKSIFKYQR